MVVFGGGTAKGMMPPNAKYRVEKAVELKDDTKKILMSGYKPFEIKKDPTKSEAELMKDFAINLGVDKKNIILEEKSLDTVGNIVFSKFIIDKKGYKNIAFVSSDFHMKRIENICKDVFGDSYNMTFIGAKSEKEDRIKTESSKTKEFKGWFGDTKTNDNDELEIFIEEQHPFYKKDK